MPNGHNPGLQEHVEDHSQVCRGSSIPRDTQRQAGWGSEKPALAVGVPIQCRGLGLDDPYGSNSNYFMIL